MKLSVSFLVFVAVFQFGSSNVISKSGTQEQLLSDANALQNGSNVIMAKPGPLEVVLNNARELIFEVCSLEWNGDFLLCYAPHPSNQNVLEDSCDTKCGFYITTLNDMEPISSETIGVGKSDQCFEVKMKNGVTSVLALTNQVVASPITCAPKIENGIVKLNIINLTSECSVSGKNAIAKHEPTTAPPTTTLGQLDQTSSGENGHASATTDEPESFFADNWWIFLILCIILIAIGVGIGIGVYCYRRRKKKAQKPIQTRRRKLRESQSPVVSTETQQRKTESAVRPDSLFQQSSILSHKSLKETSMPFSSVKQQLIHQQQRHLDNVIKLHLVKMDMLQPMNQKASLLIIGGFFQSLFLSLSPLVLELASTVIFDVVKGEN